MVRHVAGEAHLNNWERVRSEWMDAHRDDIGDLIRLKVMVEKANLYTDHLRWVLPSSWEPKWPDACNDSTEIQLLGLPVTWANVSDPYIALRRQ